VVLRRSPLAQSYGDKHFWDERYASTCSTLFDWYQDWETLAAVVQPLLRPTSRVLHLGCGNSPLAEQLHDAGVTVRRCRVDST